MENEKINLSNKVRKKIADAVKFFYKTRLNYSQEIVASQQDTITLEEYIQMHDDILKEFEVNSPTNEKTVDFLINSKGEKIIILDDIDVEAEFGVNQEYDGFDELKPIGGTPAQNELSQVETSVVSIDENGVPEAQNSISDALNAVSTENGSANISTFSAGTGERAQSARTGNIVVALDPGHDANDAGAQGYGLREEVLTLKIAQYCKAELEQYAGVSVYMTRTGLSCPYNCTNAGECIKQRAQAAAAAGAEIFVSFHLNSSVSPKSV